jgi:hypothetical protein
MLKLTGRGIVTWVRASAVLDRASLGPAGIDGTRLARTSCLLGRSTDLYLWRPLTVTKVQ